VCSVQCAVCSLQLNEVSREMGKTCPCLELQTLCGFPPAALSSSSPLRACLSRNSVLLLLLQLPLPFLAWFLTFPRLRLSYAISSPTKVTLPLSALRPCTLDVLQSACRSNSSPVSTPAFPFLLFASSLPQRTSSLSLPASNPNPPSRNNSGTL
jgi:hypothetical protein